MQCLRTSTVTCCVYGPGWLWGHAGKCFTMRKLIGECRALWGECERDNWQYVAENVLVASIAGKVLVKVLVSREFQM